MRYRRYRAAITAAFREPIVNSFASTEGLVGCSAPDAEIITLASDGCIVAGQLRRVIPV